MSCCGGSTEESDQFPVIAQRKMPDTYKIAMVGNTYVGKTTICQTYLGHPDAISQPTQGSSFDVKRLTLNDKNVMYSIWDTAGQERYNAILPIYIRESDAILIVYSLNDVDSFQALEKWFRFVQEGSPDADLYFVGTKIDLIESRAVTEEMIDGCDILQRYQSFKINSRDPVAVQKIFDEIGIGFLNRDLKD
ncbi:Ras family GTPase [uncultured virus]|nr:Ras family GTPase [uncultured virus]